MNIPAQQILHPTNPEANKPRIETRILYPNDPTSAQARREFEKLRYRVYCEEMRWEPENIATVERDKYDSEAIYIVAYVNDRLVGGCRVIDGRKVSLPIESLVGEIERNSVELSRMIITKTDAPAPVNLTLYGEIFSLLARNCYTTIYAVIRKEYYFAIKLLFPGAFKKHPLARGVAMKKGKKIFIPIVGKVKTLGALMQTKGLAGSDA